MAEQEAPFQYEMVETCYALVDEWDAKIDEMETKAKELQRHEGLFDVTISNWKEIRTCRQEVLPPTEPRASCSAAACSAACPSACC